MLARSQSQLYFAISDAKYQDIGSNGVYTYPPIFLFFNIKIFPIEDIIKITSHFKILSLLKCILSQKTIFPYSHRENIEILVYDFLQLENKEAY